MEKELTIETLVKELFELDELHEEYQNNDTHFVIDTRKDENNTLWIKVQVLKNNKDKLNFEEWLKNVDNDLFEEVLDELSDEGLINIDNLYNSDRYQEVIEKIKSKTKEIANRKIKQLQELISR